MRDQSVPCRGSTLAESIAGRHRTFEDSAMCKACQVKNARAVAAVRNKLAQALPVRTPGAGPRVPALPGSQISHREVGERGPVPGLVPVPASSLPDAYVADRDAPASPLATSQAHPSPAVVLDARTASRGSGNSPTRAGLLALRRVHERVQTERFTSTVPTHVGLDTTH